MKTGPAFSIEVIDSEVVPIVPKHLMPWLIRDRREAQEGAFVKDSSGKTMHDGAGLDKAQKALRQVEIALTTKQTDAKIIEFLQEQLATAKGKVEFYSGKIYLLDKIIATGGV